MLQSTCCNPRQRQATMCCVQMECSGSHAAQDQPFKCWLNSTARVAAHCWLRAACVLLLLLVMLLA
jgi:hypothetical protein